MWKYIATKYYSSKTSLLLFNKGKSRETMLNCGLNEFNCWEHFKKIEICSFKSYRNHNFVKTGELRKTFCVSFYKQLIFNFL